MTLQSWVLGRSYVTGRQTRFWKPLVEIADAPGKRLSFTNLVEANVLAAIRRTHAIAIPKIRAALDFVRQELAVARPLADEQFATNGVDLFVQRFGELINASRHGQRTLQEQLIAALKRIEREHPSGMPIRLYAADAQERVRSQHVAFDPVIAFGRPVLVRSGTPIAAINARFRAGDSVDTLADEYGVEREAVEEAIRQAEILRAA
jgi:uncharacterized protein (DUF433 family)